MQDQRAELPLRIRDERDLRVHCPQEKPRLGFREHFQFLLARGLDENRSPSRLNVITNVGWIAYRPR